MDVTKCPAFGNTASNLPPCLAGMKIYEEAQKELERIRSSHHTLAPTGCTPEFCQSGRATRLNEPRVGRDRPIAEIEQEATGFLKECREQGIIKTDQELSTRIQRALCEIKETAVESVVTDNDGNRSTGLAGGVWEQTSQELEYGLRASWRNSRRCIMRSKFEQLALCDLRHVTSSQEMAEAVLEGMVGAFNDGHIIPTTFVFPPRHPKKRGPMIWNGQILAFAGYRLDDGTIMGDPANVDLTENVIELGWEPPAIKSRWDLLPIVTMAEGERPYIMELPSELKRTVKINHPRYRKEFEDLDLRWVVAPALSRLGFDLGGNQYTASPFMGWFMDAEIGVRNLADTFRYNVLPDIVNRLKLSDGPHTSFEDLPEFMRLAALSRAQAELNFAVYYSYMNEQVTMVDTLTSSADYQKFDQERQEETGYRLPADPYWLSPPQGSIVPLWHQGAAPNYQPKPMICRHVQDPIKAWRRESSDYRAKRSSNTTTVLENGTATRGSCCKSKVKVFSCSAGINAGKMAKKLVERLKCLGESGKHKYDIDSEKALNSLDFAKITADDIILIVASTTGRGEIPRNAGKFMKRYESAAQLSTSPHFSVFGNGDSTYNTTYNAASIEISKVLERLSCKPLFNRSFTGDTAVNNPDWESFNHWLENIECKLQGIAATNEQPLHPIQPRMITAASMATAELVRIERGHPNGLLRVTLDVGDRGYQEMDHIKILAPNDESSVMEALASLKISADQTLTWHHETAHGYLSRYVDLNYPFQTLHWYPGFNDLEVAEIQQLKNQKAKEVLRNLRMELSQKTIEMICNDMSPIQPKLFSTASSPAYVRANVDTSEPTKNLVDIIVKKHSGGRFSDTFLSQAKPGAKLRFSLTKVDCWDLVRRQELGAPFIAITTGSGIGPVCSILQRRLADASLPYEYDIASGIEWDLPRSGTPFSENSSDSGSLCSSVSSLESAATSYFELDPEADTVNNTINSTSGSVSLFAGFKGEDAQLIEKIIRPTIDAKFFDMLELVPSNSQKVRVQDHLLLPAVRAKLIKQLQHPGCIVYICGNQAAADATAINLSDIVGHDIKEVLQDRYIEEVFRH